MSSSPSCATVSPDKAVTCIIEMKRSKRRRRRSHGQTLSAAKGQKKQQNSCKGKGCFCKSTTCNTVNWFVIVFYLLGWLSTKTANDCVDRYACSLDCADRTATTLQRVRSQLVTSPQAIADLICRMTVRTCHEKPMICQPNMLNSTHKKTLGQQTKYNED